MPITTAVTMPPEIREYFDHMLLIYPTVGDNLEKIFDAWKWIEKKLWKKLRGTPGKKKKCEALKKEFLDLYERTKAKEEKLEKETVKKTQVPFYYVGLSNRRSDKIWGRLRYRCV